MKLVGLVWFGLRMRDCWEGREEEGKVKSLGESLR